VSAFIDAHGQALGVEPICKVLQVASSAYRLRKRESPSRLRSERAKSDEQSLIQIRRVWDESGQRYGSARCGSSSSGTWSRSLAAGWSV
jgi:hypothetical protein